jgi:hypothetical protein
MLPSRRPESWNAKMPISGKPLILDRHFEQLLANELKTDDETELAKLKPVLKIFLPHIRWYLISLKADLDTAFAVVQLGAERPETGLVSLSDIVNSRLGAYVRPERDLYTKLDLPWTSYLNAEDAA